MGFRVSIGRPLEEEEMSDESEVGEPTGKNFAIPSPSCAALMDLPYDFGVRTTRRVMLS
jgi:hypothetical protein